MDRRHIFGLHQMPFPGQLRVFKRVRVIKRRIKNRAVLCRHILVDEDQCVIRLNVKTAVTEVGRAAQYFERFASAPRDQDLVVLKIFEMRSLHIFLTSRFLQSSGRGGFSAFRDTMTAFHSFFHRG